MTGIDTNWRTIGEVIGLAAIVLSLVFVGLEIRYANQATQQDAINELILVNNEFHRSIVENPDLAAVVALASSGQEADPESAEFHQLRHLAWLLHNNLILLDATSRTGQMSEQEQIFWVTSARLLIEAWPGITPHLRFAMQDTVEVSGESFDELLQRYTENRPNSAYRMLLEVIASSD